MASFQRAAYHDEDQSGLTVAVALLVRVEGSIVDRFDVDRWVRALDATIRPMLGADANSPVGIAIRVTERSGKQVAENLVLDAAVACPTYFKRSQDEARTVAHYAMPRGGITN